MAQQNVSLLAFNRGLVSRLALARADIERIALSSEVHVNFVPRVLGSMMLRPGLGHLGSTRSDAFARYVDFVFSTVDTALLEFTDGQLRVWVDDALVARPAVSSAVTNPGFDTDLTGWTDADEAGGTSQWAAGGFLSLNGNGTDAARLRQEVAVVFGDLGVAHALRIEVERGSVRLKVGTTAGAADYVAETALGTGVHSIAFTPVGNFHVELSSRLQRVALVDSCAVEGAGTLELPTPWAEADLDLLRKAQSADVVYFACDDFQQRQVERRANDSWSLVLYAPEDGPFLTENLTPITLTASGLTGNVTLTASQAIFETTHVGALFSVTSVGQRVEQQVTAENTFSNGIRITGVGASRAFTVIRANIGTSTATLQRSLDEPGSWEDVATYTTDATVTFNDGLDNQVAHYRIGVKTGDYTSPDAVDLTLNYALGSITGIVRVTGFASSTSMAVEVLTPLGGTGATEIWAEGEWSDFRGWPTAVTFVEGRLGWFGRDRSWLSVSDAYASFNQGVEGDSGPILRNIGAGAVDNINWALALQQLLLGADGSEISCRSSSFDEILTPTVFNPKLVSTQGSAPVEAIKVDTRGMFVQKSETRLFEVALGQGLNYEATDLMALVPELAGSGIFRVAVQRQPDTRVHCVLGDGTVALLVFDRTEQVLCWVVVDSPGADGMIEDVVVLPGAVEDQVYYVVNRFVNGGTVRHLEKWATEGEARGGAANRLVDAFVTYSGAATNVLTNIAPHLVGEEVIVWADGVDLSPDDEEGEQTTYTVEVGGTVTLDAGVTVSEAVVGLPYRARWQSSKLARALEGSTGLTQKKQLPYLGLVLVDTHAKGLRYGPSFDFMDPLPEVKDGAVVDADAVHEAYDDEAVQFPGEWDTDARVCLEARAPRPCTVLALVVEVEQHANR